MTVTAYFQHCSLHFPVVTDHDMPPSCLLVPLALFDSYHKKGAGACLAHHSISRFIAILLNHFQVIHYILILEKVPIQRGSRKNTDSMYRILKRPKTCQNYWPRFPPCRRFYAHFGYLILTKTPFFLFSGWKAKVQMQFTTWNLSSSLVDASFSKIVKYVITSASTKFTYRNHK